MQQPKDLKHFDSKAFDRQPNPGPNLTRAPLPSCLRFRSRLRAPFVDWLRFTLPYTGESFAWVDGTFGGRIEREQGLLSYAQSAFLGHGGICAWTENKPRNRIMVDLSARALHSLDAVPRAFCADVINRGGQFSRVDVAIDDYDGNLSPEAAWVKMKTREVNTRWKSFSRVQSISYTSSFEGYTVYLGSRDTQSFARIYDKAAQMGLPYHWTRFELEYKKDRAQELAGRISRGTIDLAGLALYQIRFLEPAESMRKHWETSEWWTDFLQVSDTDRLYMPQYEIGLEDVRRWLHDQTSGALALLARTYGPEGVQELLERGEDNFSRNKRYQQLEQKFYEGKNLEPIGLSAHGANHSENGP